MTLQEAFELINNLDIPEHLKGDTPKYSIIIVSPSSEVVDVVRCEDFDESFQAKLFEKYPETAQFIAMPGMYNIFSKFAAKVKESGETIKRLLTYPEYKKRR